MFKLHNLLQVFWLRETTTCSSLPRVMALARVLPHLWAKGMGYLVIKSLTTPSVRGITGTARSAEGELVLVVGLSFLLNGAQA